MLDKLMMEEGCDDFAAEIRASQKRPLKRDISQNIEPEDLNELYPGLRNTEKILSGKQLITQNSARKQPIGMMMDGLNGTLHGDDLQFEIDRQIQLAQLQQKDANIDVGEPTMETAKLLGYLGQ